MTSETIRHCRAVIAHHSKSFALASRFLPPRCRDEVAAVYAWCRHADDAVDLAGAEEVPSALQHLRDELDGVYAGRPMMDPALRAFQEVVGSRGIPRSYPQELLEGMAMDVGTVRYASMDGLLLYAFRVAGTVGLMMCHVMGLRDAGARRHAAHLGIAMQLTNVCRDVLEDWGRHRLYLPADRLMAVGLETLGEKLGRPFPAGAAPGVAVVVRELLAEAERYYRSGDDGLDALSVRCAVAVRAARLVYSAIGQEISRRDYDVMAGRVWVSKFKKIGLSNRAALEVLWRRTMPSGGAWPPVRLDFAAGKGPVSFPGDVLPV